MSFLVLFAYQTFFSKPTPVPGKVATPAPTTETEGQITIPDVAAVDCNPLDLE